MTGITQIPLTTLNDGTRHFGPAAVADTDVMAILSIDRAVAAGLNTRTNATTLEMMIDQTNDGGTNWFPLVDTFFFGGLVPAIPPPKGPGGNATTATVGVRFAPGTGRQTRATIITTGGPVAVQGTLTIS